MNNIIDWVAADIETLQAGGVDAIMFGNEGDRPYVLKANPESLAAMASAIGQLKRLLKVPFGVNYLWDPVATVALGVATGASFGREIFTGVYASDMGVVGAEMRGGAAAAAQSGPRRHEAAVQHQRRVRRAARTPARSPSAPRARCSRRWPTSSASPAR